MGIHPNTPSGLAELGSYCCELPDGIDLGSKLQASSPQVSAQHPKKPFRGLIGKTELSSSRVLHTDKARLCNRIHPNLQFPGQVS